jgi:hypothetical protein
MSEPQTKAGRAPQDRILVLLQDLREWVSRRNGGGAAFYDRINQAIDIDLLQWEAEASRIDVERLARAFVAVGMVIDGMTAAEARQMVEQLAAEYEKLA